MLYLDDNLQIARQVLALEFEFARADAALLTAQPEPANPGDQQSKQGDQQQKGDQQPRAGGSQNLAKAAADADARQQKQQAVVAALEKQVEVARTAKARQIAVDQLAAERADLALMQARAQTLKSLADFVAQSGGNGGELLGQIAELERSVPEARAAERRHRATQWKKRRISS